MKDRLISLGSKQVLKFHPLHKRIKDGTLRCIGCGQIDEPEVHEDQYCPGMGGMLPFPTSTVTIKLKADDGYRCEITQLPLYLAQWIAILRITHTSPPRPMVAGDIGV